jgi:hypothetical protein
VNERHYATPRREAFPTGHPLHAAPPSTFLSDSAKEALREADVVLALGWIDTAGTLKARLRRFGNRPAKTRGGVSRGSILSMVFKLVKSAEERWRALRASELIARIITGVQFKNGVEVPNQSRQKVAA